MSGTLVDNIEWCRVADRMPDDSVDCIVSDRCGEIYLAYHCGEAWYINHPSFLKWDDWPNDHFIWWAYAPKPPQEQKQT